MFGQRELKILGAAPRRRNVERIDHYSTRISFDECTKPREPARDPFCDRILQQRELVVRVDADAREIVPSIGLLLTPALPCRRVGRKSGQIGQGMAVALAELDVVQTETSLGNRVAYAETLGQGKGVLERGKGAWTHEIEALRAQVRAALAG